MKEKLRARAKELGFDDCRFTSAKPPASAAQFEQWLAAGKHGEMGYLARNANKRVEPQHVLEGAKSIIVLAAAYRSNQLPSVSSLAPSEEERAGVRGLMRRTSGSAPCTDDRSIPETTTKTKTGVIARYAQFADYHNILAPKLKELADFVNHLGGPDARSLWYVDTGPILERDLAQRAGLGFIGKHTNLINRGLGNWFFIAEILTTVPLEPDTPEVNRCGTCSRCIAACPTSAITAPFQLDARRCISYLTIELKGSIPVELRPLLGNRIYGCDDCLQVCPWNRFAREGALMKPHSRADLQMLELLALLNLDDAAFKQKFAGTPMLRTKRRGLLRNVCVALGNVGDKSCLPALRNAAKDPEPLIAEHATWAINQILARI